MRYTADTIENAWTVRTTPGEHGCLIWTGGLDGPSRVPYLRFQGRKYLARRVSWQIKYGAVPGHYVIVTCGTEACVAPEHLAKLGLPPALQTATSRRVRRPIADRFWEKVTRGGVDECWNWGGQRCSSGYGQISRGARTEGAITTHRLSYELARGAIPEGMVVRHRCDNRVCVNPAHLELGTHLDNMRDRDERGRTALRPGMAHPQARLTDADIVEIRRVTALGVPQKETARRFGVAPGTVSDISRRRRWGHVE